MAPSPIGNWQSPDEEDDPDLWPEWYQSDMDDEEIERRFETRHKVLAVVAVVAIALMLVLIIAT